MTSILAFLIAKLFDRNIEPFRRSPAIGWTTVAATPSKTKVNVDGLTSGTKCSFRVRNLGNGQPGLWSGPVQQMAA